MVDSFPCILILFIYNYPLILLQERWPSLHLQAHQLPNLSGFPTKKNSHELCSLMTQTFTQHSMSSEIHLMLKCSTRYKTHKYASEDTDVTQNMSSPKAASPASFPHVLPNFTSLTWVIFRDILPFSESWQIYVPCCFCLNDLFIHVFFSCIYLSIHVFISHFVPKWIFEAYKNI